MPDSIGPVQAEHLDALLHQDGFWVTRARWKRWLADGQMTDTQPIDEMPRDARVAALAWLSQQRNVLYAAVTGLEGRAPDGWIAGLPLSKGLSL